MCNVCECYKIGDTLLPKKLKYRGKCGSCGHEFERIYRNTKWIANSTNKDGCLLHIINKNNKCKNCGVVGRVGLLCEGIKPYGVFANVTNNELIEREYGNQNDM